MVDWLAVKTEYVTTATSYRELAKKYGLRYKTLADKGKAEKWVEERNRYQDKAISAAEEAMAAQNAKLAVKFQAVAVRLLEKIAAMMDAGDDGQMSAKDVRAIAAAMGDLKDILDIKSEPEKRERDARIANLERQARPDGDKDQVVTVRMLDGLEEFAG